MVSALQGPCRWDRVVGSSARPAAQLTMAAGALAAGDYGHAYSVAHYALWRLHRAPEGWEVEISRLEAVAGEAGAHLTPEEQGHWTWGLTSGYLRMGEAL